MQKGQLSGIPEIETVFMRIRKSIKKQDIRCFQAALILCCVVYFPFLTSWLGNPDSFRNGIIYKNGSDWENRQGDFGLTFIYKIKSYYISPVLSTIAALFLLSLICVLLKKSFEITKKWQICSLLFFVVFSPNICSTLTYYYCSDSYLLAYVLSVAAFYLLIRNHTQKGWLISVCFLTLSLSCNQAYLSVLTVLLLMFAFYQLLNGQKLSEIIGGWLRGMAAGICSVILYFIVFRFMQLVWGFQADKSPFVFIPGQIPSLVKNTYLYCFSYYFKNDFLYNEWYGRKCWNLIMALCLAVFLILYFFKRKPGMFRGFCVLISIALLPPALMLMSIIAPSPDLLSTISMKMPMMNYVYLLPILAFHACSLTEQDGFVIRGSEWILACFSLRIAVMLIVFVTAFEGYMQLNWNRMMTASVDIEKQIEMVTASHGMKSGEMKVMFAGELPDVAAHNMLIDAVGGTMAEFKMAWNNEEGRQRSWSGFMRHSAGKNYVIAEGEIYQKITETDIFSEMPAFPVDGYVKEFEDVIVVKLGNNY